jgi:hypothetical protein
MAARKETRSLADLIADVAYRKSRAALARFAGTPPGLEAPRDVYLAACASIGAHLEGSYRFRYAKSGPHAQRRTGEFIFQISFQSSVHNVAGEHVVLWIHANIRSARFKKWRQEQAHLHPTDYIAGGQLGNIQTDHSWLEWDLAKPSARDQMVADAIQAIEDMAFPYFARFEDLPALFQLLVQEDLPAMPIDQVIEFLMCFADHPTAQSVAASFLGRRPDLIEEYRESYRRFDRVGLPSIRSSRFVEALAFASHAFQFGELRPTGL